MGYASLRKTTALQAARGERGENRCSAPRNRGFQGLQVSSDVPLFMSDQTARPFG
jgi:hypothetical protein